MALYGRPLYHSVTTFHNLDIMTTNTSKTLDYPVTDTEAAAAYFRAKLEFGTDSADLYRDLLEDLDGFVVVDTRSFDKYKEAHIPTAIPLPAEETLGRLDPTKTYIVYCDGIGCNGSTKGALRLASLGLKAKELVGGIDWWLQRDRYPVVQGEDPGSLSSAKAAPAISSCGC